MFNGNTSADFDALDQRLETLTYYLQPASYIRDAYSEYETHFRAMFGSANADDPDITLRCIASFLTGADAHLTFARQELALYHAANSRTRRSRQKAKIDHGLRREVFERDGYRCRRCGDWHDLAVDHIVPESKGGTLALPNLQTLCRTCNSKKGARV